MESIILHLDMNSYFASCEQQANPHLRGWPVGVCEHLGGIIIAPSVEAKRLGIKLGTTVWDAKKIYPKIVLLPVDPDKYRHVTALFLNILHDYADKVEKYSIDEAFADITELCQERRFDLSVPSGHLPSPGEKGERAWNNALMLGLEIKQRLRQEIGEWVSCSIGIGPNKLLAKIAADLPRSKSILPLGRMAAVPERLISNGVKDKEILFDNLCIIKSEEIPLLYNYLKLTDVPGIGPRLERALQKLGIFSLRQLRNYPVENLINQFGINGYFLHELANFNFIDVIASEAKQSHNQWDRYGLRPRDDSSGEEIKSFGHSYTLPKTIREIRDIKKLMLKLAEKIGRRMRRKGARGNVIHYFHSTPSLSPPIRLGRTGGDEVGVGFSRQHKIKELINDGRDIYKAALGIFLESRHSDPPKGGEESRSFGHSTGSWPQDDKYTGIKIMGISVSGLKFDKPQEPLFEKYKKPWWIVEAMDQINNKYGEFTIKRGRLVGIPEEWGKDTVGFAR